MFASVSLISVTILQYGRITQQGFQLKKAVFDTF